MEVIERALARAFYFVPSVFVGSVVTASFGFHLLISSHSASLFLDSKNIRFVRFSKY